MSAFLPALPASWEAALPQLSAGEWMRPELGRTWSGASHDEADLQFLPPIERPPSFRDFYAFEAHVKTARAKRGLPMAPAWYEIPVFYFSNPSCLVGHDGCVGAPAASYELDYELEVGVVIAKEGIDILPENAWDYVAGLTIVNDFSARDLQRAEVSVGLGPAKAKDFATGVGPWLVPLSEVRDRIFGETLSLEMTARVNGQELSRGNARSLYHSIPRLIAHASRNATLHPGDLIGTGTVGTGCLLEVGDQAFGRWLLPGDVVELEIERLGTLRHRIVSRHASARSTD